MKKVYQEERRRKYLQELQDMNSRRHTDNFTPSQKSPIALNRYDDFAYDLPSPSLPQPSKSPVNLPGTVARALYSFQGQSSRYALLYIELYSLHYLTIGNCHLKRVTLSILDVKLIRTGMKASTMKLLDFYPFNMLM